MQKLIVTCALPYANGNLHIGHILEQIQADIWVRFNKMQSHECYFVCASDTHGTPIMLKAEQMGISPEQLIKDVHTEHVTDLNAFGISFDNYYTTHSEESKLLVYQIYNKLKDNNKIYSKIINQLYDEEKGMFLPDRFIKGTCPKCKSVTVLDEDNKDIECEGGCGLTFHKESDYDPDGDGSFTLKLIDHRKEKCPSCGEMFIDNRKIGVCEKCDLKLNLE